MHITFKQTLAAAVLGLTFCLTARPIFAKEYIDVEADDSTLLSGGQFIQSNGPLRNGPASYAPGPVFHFAVKHGVGVNVFYPDISTDDPYPGHKSSFEIIMKPRTGSGSPGEKMLADIVVGGNKKTGPNSYASVAGDTKTLGFALRLAKDFTMSDSHLMFWEWYQAGSPTGAVIDFSLKVGTLESRILIHVPVTPPGEKTPPGIEVGPHFNTLIIPGKTLELNKWYYFITSVKPGYHDDGEVTMWQNGTQVLHRDHITIGFDPTKPLVPGATGHPDKNFNICLGVYRAASHTDTAHIYMDMIRWGDTYADVAPPSR